MSWLVLWLTKSDILLPGTVLRDCKLSRDISYCVYW